MEHFHENKVMMSFPRSLSPRRRGAGIRQFTQRFLDSCLRGSDNLFVPFIFQTSITVAGGKEGDYALIAISNRGSAISIKLSFTFLTCHSALDAESIV